MDGENRISGSESINKEFLMQSEQPISDQEPPETERGTGHPDGKVAGTPVPPQPTVNLGMPQPAQETVNPGISDPLSGAMDKGTSMPSQGMVHTGMPIPPQPMPGTVNPGMPVSPQSAANTIPPQPTPGMVNPGMPVPPPGAANTVPPQPVQGMVNPGMPVPPPGAVNMGMPGQAGCPGQGMGGMGTVNAGAVVQPIPPNNGIPPQIVPGGGTQYYTGTGMSGGGMQGQMPPAYGWPQKNQEISDGMATASMILGIVSLVLCSWFYLALPCAIIGLVLGCVYRSKGGRNGMATAGIICSSVGIGFAVIAICLIILEIGLFLGY